MRFTSLRSAFTPPPPTPPAWLERHPQVRLLVHLVAAAHVHALLADELVAAGGEPLLVVLLSWNEDRAALDLLLGHVVRLGALPGVSVRQGIVMVLNAASGLEGAARLNAVRQGE